MNNEIDLLSRTLARLEARANEVDHLPNRLQMEAKHIHAARKIIFDRLVELGAIDVSGATTLGSS